MTTQETKPETLTVVTKPQDNNQTQFLGKKYTYKIDDETELKKIELDKNIVVRILDFNGKKLVDLRKYYKGFPTKRGIRLDYDTFETLIEIIKKNE